jgi:hypothetical protein
VLLRRHRAEVLRAQQFVGVPPPDLRLATVDLRPRPGLAALAALALLRRLGPALARLRERHAQEPRVEGDVERLEILASRNECLP